MIDEADSSAGKEVTYLLPAATDAVDGDIIVSCRPPPGDTFPVGETTVTCSASDKSGNAATNETFTITVRGELLSLPPP